MRKNVSGFTIVELLIVIVVIAILATITVVAYNGIQNRAYDVSVQTDLRNISKKMELARIDSPTQVYPSTNPAIAAAAPDLRVSKNAYKVSPDISYNLVFCWSNTSVPTEYALTALSKSGKRFYVSNTGAITEYTGGTAWIDAGTMCTSALPGSTASGAGYSSGDVVTGPWRSWTGN